MLKVKKKNCTFEYNVEGWAMQALSPLQAFSSKSIRILHNPIQANTRQEPTQTKSKRAENAFGGGRYVQPNLHPKVLSYHAGKKLSKYSVNICTMI